MVQLDREGKEITEQTWIDMLQKELGDEGVAIHKAMMSGQATLMVPESDDYGPCFRRVAVKIPRFDLGFGPRRSPPHRGREPAARLQRRQGRAEGGRQDQPTQFSTDGSCAIRT
jgi:hypothetical protein